MRLPIRLLRRNTSSSKVPRGTLSKVDGCTLFRAGSYQDCQLQEALELELELESDQNPINPNYTRSTSDQNPHS